MKILLIAENHPEGLLNIQALIQRLVQKYDEVHISLMAPEGLQSLARRLPDVDELFTFPDASMPLKYFWLAGRQLEEYHFDQAIVLNSSWRAAMVAWMSGIERRTGYLRRMRVIVLNDTRWLNTQQFATEKAQYLALADDHGEAVTELPDAKLLVDQANAAEQIKTHYLQSERPTVVLCPGGTLAQNQRWPASHWARLAAELIEQGWAIWLVAPKADQGFCEQICAGLDREQQMEISNLAGRLAWEDMVDLIAQSRAVVAQNNIFSHMALALDRPLVSLSGAHEFSRYLPENSDARSVSSDRHCQPCEQDSCRMDKGQSGTAPCIQALSVDRVRAAILSMVPMQAVD